MISVIIPNYNGENILKPCLQAVINQNLENIEIIVIDNASSDSSLDIIQSIDCKVIRNEVNTGFAVAVNQGIKMATYEYVFLLNNDVIIAPNTLQVLLKKIEQDNQIFSVQPKMLQYYSPNIIDDVGDIYTPFGWAFQLGHGLSDKYYKKSRETFSCCAGAALYRKEVFSRIGYFDEKYFAYMEDVDIGFRARRNGYKNFVTTDCKVNHIGSASFGKKMSPLRAELSGQNNYLTVRKNMPNFIFILHFPLLIIGFLLKGLKFAKLGFGKEFFNGIYKGHCIWKTHKYSVKFNRMDLELILIMYKDTFLFMHWKFRQILMKVGVDK